MVMINRATYPALWSALSLISNTMNIAPVDIDVDIENVVLAEISLAKMSVSDLLILTGVVDGPDERFDELCETPAGKALLIINEM